jgi:F0F1-type ATP synthase membrane subunit a
MAAEIRIPAPKAVKNNVILSLKLTYLAMSPPTKEVPPANAHIATTLSMSIMSLLGIVMLASC